MIVGAVSNEGKPLLPVALRGPAGKSLLVEAIIDTGFDGMLVVGSYAVAALGLAPMLGSDVQLADASMQAVPRVELEILWHGDWIPAEALVMGDEPLLGMSLLHGSDLHVEAVEGGVVTVVERPAG